MENTQNLKSVKILKSAIFLTIAGLITKIIGVLYKVPLLEIVGSEGLGYYQLVYPIFVFALIISSGGITTTLSKIIAKCENETDKKIYLKICLFESVSLSIIISVLLTSFCKKIAYFQGETNLCSSYKILCLALVACAIISSLRGYFQGQNNMKNTAWSQIIEQVGKIAFGLLFSYIFIKKSIMKSIFGVFLGLAFAEILCAIFLVILYFYSNKSISNNSIFLFKSNLNFIKKYLKNFNTELLPITLSTLISPLFSAINSLLIINLLTSSGISANVAVMLFGLSGVVLSLVGIPQIISSALSTTIFPLICSKHKTINEKNEIISFSYKMIFAFCVPCVFVFMFFSKPIVSLLYSDGLSYGNINQLDVASHIIKIVSTMVIYSSLSSFTTSLLQAENKSFKACQNLLFGSIISIICFIFLVKNPQINILGDSLSALIGVSITALLNIKDLSKTNTPKINFKKVIAMPLVSSCIMIVVMKFVFSALCGVLPAKILIMFSCFIGFVIYVLLLIILKVFNMQEISILKPIKISKNGLN